MASLGWLWRAPRAAAAAGATALGGAAALSKNEKESKYSADADIPEQWTPLPPQPEYKLEMAVIVHRHGDRTPINSSMGTNFKWDDARELWKQKLPKPQVKHKLEQLHPWIKPFGDKFNPPDALRGQLTMKGAGQLHDLGKALRARYVHDAEGFLPATLDPSMLTVRSTPVRRCFESAAALLLGLYPVSHRSSIAKKVPVYSRNAETETMWGGWSLCPVQKDITESSAQEFTEVNYVEGSEYKYIVDTLIEAFGVTKEPKELGLLGFGEILNCFEAHGENIPNVELPPNFTNRLDLWRDQQYFHRYRHSNLGSLAGGRLLYDIAAEFEVPVTQGHVARKFCQFSCHDTSLIPLMFALEMLGDDAEWPKYGSFVVFELYRRNDSKGGEPEWFVQALFNGRSTPMGNSGQSLMPWTDFEALVQRNGLSGMKWIKKCAESRKTQTPEGV